MYYEGCLMKKKQFCTKTKLNVKKNYYMKKILVFSSGIHKSYKIMTI